MPGPIGSRAWDTGFFSISNGADELGRAMCDLGMFIALYSN
jgi:hypothetical protein